MQLPREGVSVGYKDLAHRDQRLGAGVSRKLCEALVAAPPIEEPRLLAEGEEPDAMAATLARDSLGLGEQRCAVPPAAQRRIHLQCLYEHPVEPDGAVEPAH